MKNHEDAASRTKILNWLGGAAAVAFGLGVGPVLADHSILHGNQNRAPLPSPAIDPSTVDASGCVSTSVSPFLATDGQRLFLDENQAQAGDRVLLTGYRYDDAPPTRIEPGGLGRAPIYCGCQTVGLLETEDVDAGNFRQSLIIRVPDDAPSGDYSIEVLPASTTCSSGGVGAVCEVSQICVNPSLTVAPSHLVTQSNSLNINTNSEPTGGNPSEMQFLFAALSGAQTEADGSLLRWSGTFPAGQRKSAHLTSGDNKSIGMNLPLFAGRESMMSAAECREECVALPFAKAEICAQDCDATERLGRYNDRLDFSFGGVELDSSPSKAWGVASGIAAGAALCTASHFLAQQSCFEQSLPGVSVGTGAVLLGTAVGAAVNKGLADDDDNLGTADGGFTRAANDWGVGQAAQVLKMDGEGKKGDITLSLSNLRLPAPTILSYSIVLRFVELTGGYEYFDCKPPNEIFVHARAHLHIGQEKLEAPIRIPSGDEVIKMNVGDRITLDRFLAGPQEFLTHQAPEIPFAYVEISVWEADSPEDDEQKDLIGVSSKTHSLAQIINFYSDPVGGVTPEGQFTRTASYRYADRVNGYIGSDDHCHNSVFATATSDPEGEYGAATIIYDIDLTWLVTPDLR